jgi:hypothetical protein
MLALPALALLLLAAHLFHAGALPLAALAILLVGLLAVPRPWAARTLQVVLAVVFQHPVLRAHFGLTPKPAAEPATG